MDLIAAALLGVVQGLTEFLPVSSSAHLILARAFFGWNAEQQFGEAFDVACHVGTLVAVFAFFHADIAATIRALPQAFSPSAGVEGRRIRYIAIGTVPIVIAGVLFDREAVSTPLVAAIALLVGAAFLLVIEHWGPRGRGEEALTPAGALGIGMAQAAALVPGVSRSGATIATGMAFGLTREAAARFTFLLSVPAIMAAAAKEALKIGAMTSEQIVLFGIGMTTSAIVGYVTVRFFIRFLTSHRLDVFAWYRVALAAATFIWLAR